MAILRCLYHLHMSPEAPPRVLVVEDDELVRSFLRFALERGGMCVTEAEDGASALLLLGETQVDAVLIDGLLPDMHGVALADRLLDDPATAHLPICFLSGAVHARGETTAGFGCLAKPVRPAHLIARMQSLLQCAVGEASVDERRRMLRRLESGFLVGP